jgi:uncharacterized protein YjbI with pentapeptide repeats
MDNQPSPRERVEPLQARPGAGSLSVIGRPMMVLLITALLLASNVWLAVRLVEKQRKTGREHSFWVLCQPGHSLPERTAAFRRLVADGNKEWRSAQLAGLNLEGISLPNVDLTAADFQRANLASANLAGAKLKKASLELANLSGTDLSEADLSEVNLFRAALLKSKLRRTNLRAAVLQEIKAAESDLLAADLSDADCLMADFSGANLVGANFTGARLEAVLFKGANLSLARLNDANLKDTDFTNSNWWRARGLTSAQVENLKTKFPPADYATPALKQDYENWAGRSVR